MGEGCYVRTNSLHPEVQRFKQYMNERPQLKQMVRRREKTLQQLFEEWYQMGEVIHQERVEKEEEASPNWIEKALNTLASLDSNKWNSYIAECQSILEIIQLMVEDFVKQTKDGKSPFSEIEGGRSIETGSDGEN
nr:spore coat protein YlbD [Bacillus sp. REN10]